MRASLLASATASLFLCNRSDAELSHGPKLYRAQLCGRISRTFAAWISSVRRYLLPRLETRPRIDRPPVLYVWTGCSSQVRRCCRKSLICIRPVDRRVGRGLDGNTHTLFPSLAGSREGNQPLHPDE